MTGSSRLSSKFLGFWLSFCAVVDVTCHIPTYTTVPLICNLTFEYKLCGMNSRVYMYHLLRVSTRTETCMTLYLVRVRIYKTCTRSNEEYVYMRVC